MAIGSGFRRLFRRGDLDRDIEDELDFHLAMKAEDLVAEGMTPEAARTEARERLGDADWVRRECRSIGARARRARRRRDRLDALRQDLRYAVRRIRRQPAFFVFVVLVLAVGVGANTAIFSTVNGWIIRDGPGLEHPEQLVIVYRSRGYGRNSGFSHLGYLAYRDRAMSFSSLAASRPWTFSWNRGDETVEVEGQIVTDEYFSTLGVQMYRGRSFLPEENRTAGAHPVAIVSYDLWETLTAEPGFESDPVIRLHEQPFTVVGVTPPGFHGLDASRDQQVWVPLAMEAATRTIFPTWQSDYFDDILTAVGRLAPGVTLAQAQAELDVLGAQIEVPERRSGITRRVMVTSQVRAFDFANVRAARRLAPIAFGSLLVLILACVNIAGLLLVRGLARRREISYRLALGAGRRRIVRQLLTESLTLALPAALLGLAASRWVAAALAAYVPPQVDASLDVRVTVFAMGLAVLATVAFGLVPALQVTRLSGTSTLADGPGAGLRSGVQTTLVGAQLSLTLVLLVVAGSFVRTLQRSAAVDFGFAADNLYTAELNTNLAGLEDEEADRFFRSVRERIADIPGVTAVTTAGIGPRLRNPVARWDGRRFLRQDDPSARVIDGDYNEIDPWYFETLGVDLVAGRNFTTSDETGAARVAIVNETLARTLWGDDWRLGDRVRVWFKDHERVPASTVVGVVADHRTFLLHDRASPTLFVPVSQTDEPGGFQSRRTLLVRTRTQAGPETLTAIRDAVSEVDPRHTAIEIESLRGLIDSGLPEQRLWADVSTAFGVLALLLGMIGLYGTVAFAVSQRTREFGIRIALGARSLSVFGLVLRRGVLITAVGSAIGLAVGTALVRIAVGMLYEDVGASLTRTEPGVLVAVTALLFVSALVACLAPARRATATDPMDTLRHE